MELLRPWLPTCKTSSYPFESGRCFVSKHTMSSTPKKWVEPTNEHKTTPTWTREPITLDICKCDCTQLKLLFVNWQNVRSYLISFLYLDVYYSDNKHNKTKILNCTVTVNHCKGTSSDILYMYNSTISLWHFHESISNIFFSNEPRTI